MQTQTLVFQKTRGGQFRWLTVSTLLLSIGTILHIASPSIAGFTPNWMIATYCVAILLTKPTYRQCFGIGMVAACIEILTSKSGFPYGNLISEPLGAMTAACFAHMILPHVRQKSILSAVCGGVATLISGFVFVSLMTYMLGIATNVYLYAMLPAVGLVAVINGVITPVLYAPAQRLLHASLTTQAEVANVSHAGLALRPQQDAAFSIEKLSYRYPQATADALHDINLTVERGDFLVLAGAAGAGKTTLMSALCGAVPHYYGGVMSGMVFVEDLAITQHSIAEIATKVGTILPDYDAQLVTLTVAEEMEFALENRGYAAAEIARRSAEALAKVGLSGLEERNVATLSGGQRQRLVIASVLATEPKILVIDEPTSALDPEGTQAFYQLLGTLNQRDGLTVVVTESQLAEVAPYAKRAALLDEGRLVMVDAFDEVVGRMQADATFRDLLPDRYQEATASAVVAGRATC